MDRVRAGQAEREPVRFYPHFNPGRSVKLAEALRERGFQVRDHAPYPIAPPVNWAADPYADANWRYQLNAIYPAIAYVMAYRESGDRDWFDRAVQLYLDWIDFNLTRDLPNEYKWYDMATGIRAINLAYIIDHGLREGLLSAEAFAELAKAADRHVLELWNQRLAHSNHGLFQLAGIAAVCRALPGLRRCEEARQYANAGYAKLFDLQFNDEGMHLEHSPSYHVFALTVIQKLMEADYFDLEPRHVQTFQKAVENYQWLIKPDFTHPAIGDTARQVYGDFRHLHPTVDYIYSDGQRGEHPPGGVRIFRKTGYAFVRHYPPGDEAKATSYIMMSVAHHSRVHKHADPFTFEWFDAGRSILVDAGKWGYDRAAERDYVLSTRAHNTVEIDGGDDEIEQAPDSLPVLSGTVSDDGVYVLMANGERRPSGVRHRRLLVLRPGEWLLVADRLVDDEAHDLVQWLHPAETFQCEASAADDAFHCEDAELKFTVRPLAPAGGLVHERGVREPRLQGWISPEYAKLVPADALGFVQNGVETGEFVTLVDLAGGHSVASTVEFTDSSFTACWSKEGVRHGVAVEWADDGELRVERCAE
ncbi:MAG TPA: alginate lyase family protein [Gammaproteobacteria bacterium]